MKTNDNHMANTARLNYRLGYLAAQEAQRTGRRLPPVRTAMAVTDRRSFAKGWYAGDADSITR